MINESLIDQSNEELWNERFKDSAEMALKAEKVLHDAEALHYEKGIAYAKLNIAAAMFLTSRNDRAQKFLTESISWFEKNDNEKGWSRALLLEGNIFESFGDYEKTLSLWLRALKAASSAGDIEAEGEACSQLGLVYFRLSDYPKALQYFNTGLKIREELNDENAVASSLNRIGMVLRQTKRYPESLEYYFKSLSIREKNGQVTAIPWTYLGIANTFEDCGKTDEALSYYQKGAEGSDRRCALQCIMGQGRIHSLWGENEKAEKLLNESLEIAKGLKTLYLIAEAYSALAKHYELSGEPKKALENYKLFQETRESLLNVESQSRLRNIEISNAVEKAEKEKEIYRLRNVELKNAYAIIEERNSDITSSINYASRIQNAILPRIDEFPDLRDRIFILYFPKDIVSGDFYWFSEVNDKLVIAAGDCTGHGVPGALMSMLGISSLEDIVDRRNITDPGLILDELSRMIRQSLHQNDGTAESKDGMDISICSIDKKTGTVLFSAANNNLYFVSNGELNEYKADRMPAGFNFTGGKNFTVQEIKTCRGDILYMYSDGFADQFGGPKNKKYKYSTLKEMLLKIHMHAPAEQKKMLEEEFISWKGKNTQVDDVMVIGYRI